jgi:hypothetical protein
MARSDTIFVTRAAPEFHARRPAWPLVRGLALLALSAALTAGFVAHASSAPARAPVQASQVVNAPAAACPAC